MLALPCCRRGGSLNRGGEGAQGASATGSEELPPAASIAARGAGGGGGARGECPPLTWWPLAKATSDPWVGIDAAVMRGYSRPPRCG